MWIDRFFNSIDWTNTFLQCLHICWKQCVWVCFDTFCFVTLGSGSVSMPIPSFFDYGSLYCILKSVNRTHPLTVFLYKIAVITMFHYCSMVVSVLWVQTYFRTFLIQNVIDILINLKIALSMKATWSRMETLTMLILSIHEHEVFPTFVTSSICLLRMSYNFTAKILSIFS